LNKEEKEVQGPRQRLNRRERRALVRILLLACIVAGFFLAVAPGCSLYSYCRTQQQKAALVAENAHLIKETEALKEEIHLLQHDEGYLERIARGKYGMLKKNEEVYYLAPPRREGN
jgi:cell division protein FtsB